MRKRCKWQEQSSNLLGMARIEEGERMSATVLQEPQKVKIRKDHICQGCGKKLHRGEDIYSSSFASDGQAWTFYECDSCREFYDNHCATCDDCANCVGFNYAIGLFAECRAEMERGRM